ncbi:hypothetical protein OOK31_14820 [Streptomyces sp. NBC_00249]|uniref:hypothetical protein n=1 Tax=Streptomyces sp. NBC_00249 TaxID=2975690 RepID=UPI0022582E66|nr:hypothetical protein [Streptomyces sp. NBC_00249]MCX5195158.1 hypothetical protein [Streptomyces sp. NBC_00249]
MQSRRALPLLLAVLMLVPTAGCVTVRPGDPPRAPRQAPAGLSGRGLPLGVLPEVAAPPAAPGTPTPDGAASPEAAEAPAAGAGAQAEAPRRGDDRPPRRADRPDRPAHRAPARAPGHAHAPAPAPARAAKPRAKKPVRPKAPPAPGRSYDMAPLCRAARGTVSPDIVALCR